MSDKESNQGNEGGLAERLVQMLGLKKSQVTWFRFLAIGLALGILFLNADSLFGLGTTDSGRPPQNATEVIAPASGSVSELARLEEAMARRLEEQLSLIDGAGTVRVKVTLESGHTQVPLTNERIQETRTDERAGDESTRTSVTTQTDRSHVVYRDNQTDVLAVATQLRPQIAGVQIVATGASNDAVRARLHEAAMTALRVGAHRIDVKPAAREGR